MSDKMKRTSSVDFKSFTIENLSDPDTKSILSSNPTLVNLKTIKSPSDPIDQVSQEQRGHYFWKKNIKKLEKNLSTTVPKLSKSIINRFGLGSYSLGQRWRKSLKNRQDHNTIINFGFQSQEEIFVTGRPSPSSSSSTTTTSDHKSFKETSIWIKDFYTSSSSLTQIQSINSQRISYDSSFTTINYTDLIRNSVGSDLSFRCRGLISSTEEVGLGLGRNL
ncbi:hypothetical protein CROQUDRAFT_464523 [Cronartium quercuum f. sp. fusiforme G11]|uniref:Uncharacterized protein n=1 Tax=Cronartium quercuum f. sp. fusiforme G11 TaxID=708437 RepID=A0A9P6NT46_9BASI|nr:hypothetical protein CROQUDRAFT_464523 [Cronartium quercuum f. sp. fusiforme G11]